MEILIEGINQLPKAVKQFHQHLNGRKKLMIYGEIGAGKTTFIKAFCEYLGVEDPVNSPTFAIINEYVYPDQQTKKELLIHHLDLYRLKTAEEALFIGMEDYLYDDFYCIIEWPGLIEDYFPENAVKIKIEIIENSSRKIIFL